MTNQLEALIAEMKAAAEKASKGDWTRKFDDEIHLSDGVVNIQLAAFLNDSDYLAKLDAIHVAASQPKNVLALIAALEQAQQQCDSWRDIAQANIFERGKDISAPDAAGERIEKLEDSKLVLPEGLHPDSAKLVCTFAEALAAKLRKAEIKYGYDSDWKKDGWQDQCLAHFHQHIGKGDPLDVAAYCAFMWHHNWPTAASPLAVKLPVLASIHSNWSGEYLLKSEVIEAIRAAGGTVDEGE